MGQYKAKFENNKINREKDTLDKRLLGEIYKELKVNSKKTNYHVNKQTNKQKTKGNTLNRHLTKEDIQMVNKHIKDAPVICYQGNAK